MYKNKISHGGCLHTSLEFYYSGNREPQVTFEQGDWSKLVQHPFAGM